MKKLLLSAAALFAIQFAATAQISTLPYTQDFTEAFSATGNNVQIYPNYTANEAQTSTRIFWDQTDYNSAPAALSVIPTSGFEGQLILDFNLANYSNVNLAFMAKSMANSTGTRPSTLTLAVSTDGGTSWIGDQLVATLPNENQTAFTAYTYTLPAAVNNQSAVKVRFFVSTGTGGTGTRAKVVIDDLAFSVSQVVQPTLSANATSLTFTQTLGTVTQPQVVAVTGSNLAADATATVAAPFEVSLSPTSGFATSITVPQTSGAINGSTLYVRSNGSTAGTYTGTLNIASSGITASVALNTTLVVSTATNPEPFNLASGNYTFNAWPAESAAGTYPANMKFWAHASTDPTIDVAFNEDYSCLYSLTTRSRFSGQGDAGISMVNTGSAQFTGVCDGSDPTQVTGDTVLNGRAGAVVLALNATARQNITVAWKGATIAQNNRVYALRMQYRIGAGAPNANWMDIADGTNNYTQYQSAETGNTASFATMLPADANNQPVVQVRWVYSYVETGVTGSRAEVALDDVTVTSDEYLGLDEVSNNGFVMYPNPANSVVNFTKPVKVTVYDYTGKTVFNSEKEITTLNVSGYATGIYLVKTVTGAVKKLIIK